MIWIVLMFLVGVGFSAMFSGTETGFYRATRVRLTMDALSGDWKARGMLRLTSNPSLFVATTLIGNNLANYITSLAVVLGTSHMIRASTFWVELLMSIAVSPIVFVYGELLPKNFFYMAPNRLLRQTAPLLLFCAVLFAPASALLWLMGRGLQSVVGAAPEQLQLRLVRSELRRVFEEGHEAGVLRPSQRHLAQGMLTVANRPVIQFAAPMTRLPSVRLGTAKSDVLRLARRQRTPGVLVTERQGHRIIGYVRLVDLYLDAAEQIEKPRELPNIPEDASPIAALLQLQSNKDMFAQVVDVEGLAIGLLTTRELMDQLLAP